MKCEKCGGNLTLEDVVCPYCDALNEHAVEHIREMNRYKREFEGTKDTIEAVAKSHSGIMIRIVTICVLIVLIIGCGILSSEAHSIRRNINQKNAKRELSDNQKILSQYLEDKDYYSFYAFINGRDIQTHMGEYEEYGNLYFISMQYMQIYDIVLKLNDKDAYTDKEYYKERLISVLNEFYRVYDEKEYCYVGESGRDFEVAMDVENRIKAFLVTYVGLNKEDVEDMAELTNVQRSVLIEERYLYEE